MEIEQFSEVMQDICSDETKGIMCLFMKNDGDFFFKEFGELGYLEKMGLLSTAMHDVAQEPYEEEHLILYHVEMEDDNG